MRFILMSLLFGALLFYEIHGKTTVQVVWMIPSESHPKSNFIYNASSSVAALALGLETIYNQSILPDHVFNITYLDTSCDSKESLGALVDLLFQQPVDVVFGPPCSQVVKPIGELMSYRNISVMNWVSQGQAIKFKTVLTTYIRTMAPISALGGLMVRFFYYADWRRCVIISSEGDDYRAGAETIAKNIRDHDLTGFKIANHYAETRLHSSEEETDTILSSIIHEARVIILLIPRVQLRMFMLRAHYLGMTSGDYQFLVVDTKLAGADKIALLNSDNLWRAGDEHDDDARQAFENVLYFVLGHNNKPVSCWRDDAMRAYNNMFGARSDLPSPTEPDEFSAYVHDTIVYYAKLLNITLANNNTGTGDELFKSASSVFFKGLSGDVVVSELGDRQPAFYAYDMNEQGKFHQVATVQFNINATTSKIKVTTEFTNIIWGDGRSTDDGNYKPPDSPECGFFGELCADTPVQNKSYSDVIIGVSVGMLVILIALFLVYRWWRVEQDLKNMTWKINPNELNFNIKKSLHSASYISGHFNTIDKGESVNLDECPLGQIRARNQSITTAAEYKGAIVALKISGKRKLNIDRSFMLLMKNLSTMKHANLAAFVGVCTVPDKICAAWEYCSKGSVQDIIDNEDIKLDTMFKLSIAIDICQGLEYIHKSPIKKHGNLKSSKCVIDSRWVCKLKDFGMQKLKLDAMGDEAMGQDIYYSRLLWTAPEILRKILKRESVEWTAHADIYALGIIIKELLCRNEPYCMESALSPKEIIVRVANPEDSEQTFRPEISETELDTNYRRENLEYLVQKCWAEDPEQRPTMKAILRTLNKINPYKKATVVDNMILMMEKYTDNLEDVVAERTAQLQEEKRKTDALLYRMLPRKVADDLKFGRSVKAEAFDAVTIYFSDIVQFTDLATESTPLEIVDLLNSLYTLFDDIISHYDVYKVETIGDAYMIVSGLPERNGNLHVKEMAWVALNILRSVLHFRIPHKSDKELQIRIGLHTGPVVAGVVGLTMPRYCLFGDTVNTASRMESNAKPQKIHISPQTKDALDDFPTFFVESRGEIPIKGKGLMHTYWLSGICEQDEKQYVESKGFVQQLDHKCDASEDVIEDADEDIGGYEGKVSVADSGIEMDNRALDERHNHLYLDTVSLGSIQECPSIDDLRSIGNGHFGKRRHTYNSQHSANSLTYGHENRHHHSGMANMIDHRNGRLHSRRTRVPRSTNYDTCTDSDSDMDLRSVYTPRGLFDSKWVSEQEFDEIRSNGAHSLNKSFQSPPVSRKADPEDAKPECDDEEFITHMMKRVRQPFKAIATAVRSIGHSPRRVGTNNEYGSSG